ncbi:recombination-associated protein RdgC [Vibrio metschnikovii]|nr:recombination-associated protein RdgC [Vibrio metschnikovii]
MKRLQVYTYRAQPNTIESFDGIAQKNPCPETTATCLVTVGFVKPFELIDNTTNYIENINGYGYGCIVIQEKKAKRSEVTRLFNQKIREEKANGNNLTVKEKREIRREIERKLTIKAIPQETEVKIVFDVKQCELWLSCSSTKHRDRAISLLMGIGFDMLDRPLSVTIEQDLTYYLSKPDQLPDDIELGRTTSMKESMHSSTVNYRSQDLVSSEIDENIKKQKEVKSLEVEYKNSVWLTLKSTQEVTGIKYDVDRVIEWLSFSEDEANDDELHFWRQRIALSIELISHVLPRIYAMFTTLHTDNAFTIESRN